MKSNLVIAIARHGQTDSNVRGAWIGSSGDDPLNERGVEQAKSLAMSLSEIRFDYILSSDKKRAIETAEIVSKILNVPIFGIHQILRDRHYGNLEGLTTTQIRDIYGLEMKSLSRDIEDLGRAETVDSVVTRVRDFVDIAKSTFKGKNIIVITHGAFIRSFYETYVKNADGIRFTNCANFIVEFNGESHRLLRDVQTV